MAQRLVKKLIATRMRRLGLVSRPAARRGATLTGADRSADLIKCHYRTAGWVAERAQRGQSLRVSTESQFEIVVDFERVDAADARWRAWLGAHPGIAASLDLGRDVVVDTGQGTDGDIRRYSVRVAVFEGSFSAVLRPGESDEEPICGCGADSLDAWLSTQSKVGERFTYSFTLRETPVGDSLLSHQDFSTCTGVLPIERRTLNRQCRTGGLASSSSPMATATRCGSGL